MSAHSDCLKSAALGIAPCSVSTFWPARGPKTMRQAEPGLRQPGGLFVPGEGPGYWPGAACKARPLLAPA